MFIIQKIATVRPPPGRSHRRGSCESLTAPSGCTHTQYGWHLEHLGKETQPEGREDCVKQRVRRPGRPRKTCTSNGRGRGRRRRAGTGCPLPSGCTPKPRRSHTRRPADPGGGELGIRKKAPATAARAGKIQGTSPCKEPALCSQLLLETQPGSANSLLSGASARAAVWSGPVSSLRRARSPHLRLPPARRSPAYSGWLTLSLPPALFPLFHLLLSHLPLSGSELQLTSEAPLGWRQRMWLLFA